LIADKKNDRIRKIDKNGIITTIIGTGLRGFSADGDSAANANIRNSTGLVIKEDGSILVADSGGIYGGKIRKVDKDGVITTIAGEGNYGNGVPAINAKLYNPNALALGPDGSLYITDHTWLRKIDPYGVITKFAGSNNNIFSGDGGPATSAYFSNPRGLAVGDDNSVYVADQFNHRIRKIDPKGIISTYAGTGEIGCTGDGGPATSAQLSYPGRVAIGSDRSIYISNCNRIRKIDPNGIISSIAGTGEAGFSGDGGPATAAKLNKPVGIALTNDGTIYFADAANKRIRKIENGLITTYFGGTEEAECGSGTIVNKVEASSLDDSIKNSLAVICPGTPIDIAIKDSCDQEGGNMTLVFSQKFAGNFNIVQVVTPCKN